MIELRLFASFIKRHEAKQFGMEIKFNFADWTMAVFGHEKFGDISRGDVKTLRGQRPAQWSQIREGRKEQGEDRRDR